ncbi:MAG TPA: HD domain-containing phosphohydrolase [Bryobacteraceae bacterium]|nr:HD domain-containing phosphohydrolase [Bryobacteraceae bacterium]
MEPGQSAAADAGYSTGFELDETEEILFALALAVEQRDLQTGGHCERLALFSVAMGIAMGLARQRLVALYRGGYLHDVGKIGIPDSILFKPGPLTTEEWDAMRTHPVRGEEICRHMKSLEPVLPIIRHHHERWDGSGYPDGLREEQIPLLARIVQIVDIYDALVTPRPYKKAFAPQDALAVIQKETDRGWRDPRIVNVFLQLHRTILSKIAEVDPTDRGIESMRTSLANLRRILAEDGLTTVPSWPLVRT